MSLIIQTGSLKYRQGSSDSWHHLVIRADAALDTLIEEYASNRSWALGELCLHNGEVYRCNTFISSTGEAWNSSHWTKTTVGDEIKHLNNSVASEYRSFNTYEEGQFCFHEGQLYKCITKISTAEAWNSAHWATSDLGSAYYNLLIKLASPYNPGKTYHAGDVCIHGDAIRRCKTDMSQPEAFDNNRWAYITNVFDVVGDGELDSSFNAETLTEAANELQTSLAHTDEGLAYIVDGDTCATAVPSKAYAYIKNNTHNLAEGLYRNKSNSAFPTSGGTADGTVFESVSGGGLNDLRNSITKNNFGTEVTLTNYTQGQKYEFPDNGYLRVYCENGESVIYRLYGATGSDFMYHSVGDDTYTTYVVAGMRFELRAKSGSPDIYFTPLV